MLIAGSEVEVEDEHAGVAERARSEEDGEDVTVGLGVNWLFCGLMRGNGRGRDKSHGTCPAITLVRVFGSPGGENSVKCVCVVVMEMRLLYKYNVRYKREG